MNTTLIREVTVQYRGKGRKAPTSISSPEAVGRFIESVLPDNSREHLIALYLDSANQPVGYSVLATGTENHCAFGAKELFQRALLVGAAAIIVAHNHPTGNLKPSTEDERATKLIKDGAKLLGIKFLDHVIVSKGAVFSFFHQTNLIG